MGKMSPSMPPGASVYPVCQKSDQLGAKTRRISTVTAAGTRRASLATHGAGCQATHCAPAVSAT